MLICSMLNWLMIQAVYLCIVMSHANSTTKTLHKNTQKRTLQIYINCETLFIIDTKLKYFFVNFLYVERHSFRLESIQIPKVYHKSRINRQLAYPFLIVIVSDKWIRQTRFKNWQILLKQTKKRQSETTNNDLQNTKKTTQDCATRTPQNKTGSERMFSEKRSQQFLLQNVIHCLFSQKFRLEIMNEEMTGLWLRQAVHIRDNLRRIYYISVN